MNAYDDRGRLKVDADGRVTVNLDGDARYQRRADNGIVDPAAVPADPTASQFYYNDVARSFFIWNVTYQTWDKLMG